VLTFAFRFVIGLRLGLDFMFDRLVIMHTYLYFIFSIVIEHDPV